MPERACLRRAARGLAAIAALTIAPIALPSIASSPVASLPIASPSLVPSAIESLSIATRASAQQAAVAPSVTVTDAMLNAPSPGDWLRWRGDHAATGHSPLARIDRQNVRHLRLAWSWAMGAGVQEQEPIVHDGIMYLLHPNAVVQALDATTGALRWEYRRELPRGVSAADTVRNLALYRDRVFMATQDGHLVALDAATGTVVWDVEPGDHRNRVNYSGGPIAADGKVFAGLTCGGVTKVACSVSAFDAATGRRLWTRESVAGPADPPAHQATWRGVPYERRIKASLWMAGSYDPQLKTLYWTTASAQPYPELHKGSGDGALLYTNSILALDPETGAIKWFFQMQPRDNFDMDHQDNPILADVAIDGVPRKAVFVLGKPGILWAFDRVTGAYLWHAQLVTDQNIYTRIDRTTGAITMNEAIIPTRIGVTQVVCPGMRGGKLFQTKAYDPRAGVLYSPVSNACTAFEIVPLDVSASGVRNDVLSHMPNNKGLVGRLSAVSAATGAVRWHYDQRAAIGSVLSTAGGLVFFGDLDRYFRALDAATGTVVWETPLSAPVTGYPISYAVNGRQYIAVGVGGGTPGQRNLGQLYPELKSPMGSNVLMVFALADDVAPSVAPVRTPAPDRGATTPAAPAARDARSSGPAPAPAPAAAAAAAGSGWYTVAQATRGKASYVERCSRCHGVDFVPDDFATRLTGAAFTWRWRDRTLADLVDTIWTTMPPGEGKTLGPQTTADIAAYLLQANDFPAGGAELTFDRAALAQRTLAR